MPLIIIIGLIVLGLLVAVHIQGYFLRSTLEFAVTAFATIFVIIGSIYASRSYKDNKRLARRNRSLQIIDQLNEYDNVDRRLKFEKEISDLSEEELVNIIQENQPIYTDVTQLLGLFEDIALAIKWNVADEWILYDSLGFIIPHYFNLLKPYINSIRQEYERDKLYERVEQLVDRWEKGLSIRNKKALEEPSD